MTELSHVVVKLERDPDGSGTFLLVAEAGYPNEDDVVAVIEYGPVHLDASDPRSELSGELLASVMRELSQAIAEEIALTVDVADLMRRVVIDPT